MTAKKRRSPDRFQRQRHSERKRRNNRPEATVLRIIGGRFRGSKLRYGGDPRVRPMKERVREAVFNLVGPAVKGKHAVDLFSGSGALGLEALSRGATSATLIEQHFPTAEIIRRNAATLGVEDATRIVTGNVFVWLKRQPELPSTPWLVFCSPPWDFFVERTDELLELIGEMKSRAPADSMLVVESDERFDTTLLPEAETWDVRRYAPAVVAVV